MEKVYLGLGSNIGDREKYLLDALELLKSNKNIIIKKVSSLYETPPYGYLEQADFFNLVVLIETNMKPYEMLEYIHIVEHMLDRERKIHWGPRTIDIDILLFGNRNINNDDLIIPHKEMFKRGFVLIPLMEIYDKNLDYDKKIEENLDNIKDKETIKFIKNMNWSVRNG